MKKIVRAGNTKRVFPVEPPSVIRAIIMYLLLSAFITENRGVLYAPIIQDTRTNLLGFLLFGVRFAGQLRKVEETDNWQRYDIAKSDER